MTRLWTKERLRQKIDFPHVLTFFVPSMLASSWPGVFYATVKFVPLIGHQVRTLKCGHWHWRGAQKIVCAKVKNCVKREWFVINLCVIGEELLDTFRQQQRIRLKMGDHGPNFTVLETGNDWRGLINRQLRISSWKLCLKLGFILGLLKLKLFFLLFIPRKRPYWACFMPWKTLIEFFEFHLETFPRQLWFLLYFSRVPSWDYITLSPFISLLTSGVFIFFVHKNRFYINPDSTAFFQTPPLLSTVPNTSSFRIPSLTSHTHVIGNEFQANLGGDNKFDPGMGVRVC